MNGLLLLQSYLLWSDLQGQFLRAWIMWAPLDIQSAKFCQGTKLFKSRSISLRQSLCPFDVEAVQGQVLYLFRTLADGCRRLSTEFYQRGLVNSDLVCCMDSVTSLVTSLAPSPPLNQRSCDKNKMVLLPTTPSIIWQDTSNLAFSIYDLGAVTEADLWE